MSSGSEPENAAPAAAQGAEWSRLLRLAGAITATGYSARRFRSLRVTGIMLALSGVASVGAVTALGAADVADIAALRIMAYSCWLYGALGIWALLSPRALEQEPNHLAMMRGQSLSSPWVRGVGFARPLVFGMLLASMPGLLTALIVSPSMGALGKRAVLLGWAGIYLVTLGALLGAIGALSAKAAPRAPRSFATAVVLGPFLLSFAAEEIPSVVGLYSWGLRMMIDWGAIG